MNGARIISGILGRTTVAGDQPASRAAFRRFSSGRGISHANGSGGVMMNAKKLISGAAAYTICTFSLAVGWHVAPFQGEIRIVRLLRGGAELSPRFAHHRASGGSALRPVSDAEGRGKQLPARGQVRSHHGAPSSGLPTCSPSSPSRKCRARLRLSLWKRSISLCNSASSAFASASSTAKRNSSDKLTSVSGRHKANQMVIH